MSKQAIDPETLSRIVIWAVAAPGLIGAALLGSLVAFSPNVGRHASAVVLVAVLTAVSLGSALYLLANRRREGANRRTELVARAGAPLLLLMGLGSVGLSLADRGVAAVLELPPYLFAAAVAWMVAQRLRAAQS